MPSEKPRFTIRTEQEVIDKIGYIAQKNERSSTQEIVYLMKRRIKEYEKENGKIILEEKENIFKQVMDISTDKSKSLAEKSKESFKIGYEKGLGKK